MSATTMGRLLASLLLGNAGIGAIVFSLWANLKQAPTLLQVLIAVCMLTLLGVLAFFIWAYANLPSVNGEVTPRHLHRFKLPYRKLSWDFANYLGLNSGSGQPIFINVFQSRVRVNWGKGIKPRSAYIECQRTGQRRDVMIESGNPYVRVQDIAFIPSGQWFHCQIWFVETPEGIVPLSKEAFFQMFPDFVFVFEYEGGTFTRFFPHNELTLLIDRFWSYSNRPPREHPILRTIR